VKGIEPWTLATLPVRHHHLHALGTRSPAHARHAREQQIAEAQERGTYAMERGSGLHAILLTPLRTVTAWEEGRPRRGSEYDDWRGTLPPDALVLTASDLARARGMAAAVLAHPEAVRVLGLGCEGVTYETTYQWMEPGLSAAARATPDAMHGSISERIVIADLKSAQDGGPAEWARWSVRRYGYDTQLAWYRRCVLRSLPADFPPPDVDCYAVVVESSPPYVVTVYRATPARLDAADRRLDGWIAGMERCLQTGAWPGYADGVVDLDAEEADVVLPEDEGQQASAVPRVSGEKQT
jgi:hypothetical protein